MKKTPNAELTRLAEGQSGARRKHMLPITERTFMQELRDTANGMVAENLNPVWVRAYEALADAADRLDAMHARCELPPAGGWKTNHPQNAPAA